MNQCHDTRPDPFTDGQDRMMRTQLGRDALQFLVGRIPIAKAKPSLGGVQVENFSLRQLFHRRT
jgi:hypothetical protein